LGVAIGMFAAFLGLAVGMAAILQFPQQLGNARGKRGKSPGEGRSGA
jgi:hypothetical protein